MTLGCACHTALMHDFALAHVYPAGDAPTSRCPFTLQNLTWHAAQARCRLTISVAGWMGLGVLDSMPGPTFFPDA